eukprot:3152452-Rhodomonas_salina.3
MKIGSDNARHVQSLAKKVGEPAALPEEAEAPAPGGTVQRVEMVYDQFQYKLGIPTRALAAIAKLKHRSEKGLIDAAFRFSVDKRRKEKQAGEYDFHKKLDDLAVQTIDGTDVRGWNRIATSPISWSHLHVYIIRAPGDCAKEVALIHNQVMPKLQQVVFNAAIQLHLRDLGAATKTSSQPNSFRPALRYAMKALDQPNCLRLILLGTEYGDPWQETTQADEDDVPVDVGHTLLCV